MTINDNLVVTCLSLLILLHLIKPSHAQITSLYCAPSSCGIIRNISHPFRLKDDPDDCGYGSYELACENNVASIYVNSQKYHVKEINYENQTIRLSDASINNNTCSFPKYSAYAYNFSHDHLYSTKKDPYSYFDETVDVAWPINFMSCPYPLKNISLLTEISDCANGDNFFDASDSASGRHTYIKVGHMNVSDVQHMCRIDMVVMTSWEFKDFKNVSVSEIHDSLLYGFELRWFVFCSKCASRWICDDSECNSDPGLKIVYGRIKRYFIGPNGPYAGLILILVLITAVSQAAKFIIGFWIPLCIWTFNLNGQELVLEQS